MGPDDLLEDDSKDLPVYLKDDLPDEDPPVEKIELAKGIPNGLLPEMEEEGHNGNDDPVFQTHTRTPLKRSGAPLVETFSLKKARMPGKFVLRKYKIPHFHVLDQSDT